MFASDNNGEERAVSVAEMEKLFQETALTLPPSLCKSYRVCGDGAVTGLRLGVEDSGSRIGKGTATAAERKRVSRARKRGAKTMQEETGPTKKAKTAIERNRQSRARKIERELDTALLDMGGVYQPREKAVHEQFADREFEKRFNRNKFGVSCAVCDRLWFQNDLTKCPAAGLKLLAEHYDGRSFIDSLVCRTCYGSLRVGKLPKMSTANGFVYPPKPEHLPPLDVVSERLISPRLPFMQIRRLRTVFGSKGLIGQVVNIPVDVDQMVSTLPRMLDDDQAFNVNIKRHQIHKSSYLSGYVTKGVVKEWLRYLLTTELYKLYNVRVDASFFDHFGKRSALEASCSSNGDDIEALVESLEERDSTAHELLLAKQHTLMWSEEKYLDIAPGMKIQPLSLLYDEHAEELSFPSIYFGTARRFKVSVTPYVIASSEIRRTDRRGVTPEHVLYMAAKVMRFRLLENIGHSFVASDENKKITKRDLEDRKFVEGCLENNLAFLRTIPNSAQYWLGRKRDVFAMIRQLGKPTLFLTLSASEYMWGDLLRLLYRLRFGKEYAANDDPVTSLGADLRTTLVNEDPVACCLYFDKLVDTIMWLLKSSRYSPFGQYHVVDFFKRIEFQQRGSPHAHILLWLKDDPCEVVSENMPLTVRLVDSLSSVNDELLVNPRLQTHRHTFTCYKKVVVDDENKQCRFGAPFWPIEETVVLLPMAAKDPRRSEYRQRYSEMHHALEYNDYTSLEDFLDSHGVDYSEYLNVLRAGIARPRIFLRRAIQQKFINNFNPWIAEHLMSNMDIQFILEEYSCAMYVVEYVNKTNRGLSNLHRELIKLRDEYPDMDYTQLIRTLGSKMLNAVEISSQEAAWYLLGLNMSEASRKVEYIPTVWPHERFLVRKSKAEMDKEQLSDGSSAVWRDTVIDKYQARPAELEGVTLAEFVALWYTGPDNQYRRRKVSKVIRYRNYSTTELAEYKREMVLLHVPFRDEFRDVLDGDKYLTTYQEQETLIMERRQQWESDLDIDAVMDECRKLMVEEEEEQVQVRTIPEMFTAAQAEKDDLFQKNRDPNNDDIAMQNVERLPGVVRRRENVMTAEEYRRAVRSANRLQRNLVLDVIYRLITAGSSPMQIFLTGPAGCGKTWLVKLLMETYNRFSQQHTQMRNAYIACASTGMAAAAIGGSTVHSAFRISNSHQGQGLSMEVLQLYRSALRAVRAVFLDECSMIGSGMLNVVNGRLQHILQQYEKPFGGMDMCLTGDLRQLPPVCQSPIYKRSRQNFCAEVVWQQLKFYPLEQVMRQSDVVFSTILTKIGDGEPLTDKERALIESRFVTRREAERRVPGSIRLFFNTSDVLSYNNAAISGEDVIEYVALDTYSGANTAEQLRSARAKVHKMKAEETGGMPYIIRLQLGRPYMVRSNVDVTDGLVNGVIGLLRYIERDPQDETAIRRLWFEFENPKVGKMLRAKCAGYKATNHDLQQSWVPIMKRSAVIQLKSRVVSCKRIQFPIVEACAITIHKSQGGTYRTVVYDYKKSHDQQLVYVALSRATSLDGLYITNSDDDFTFYHARGRRNQELRNEFERLRRNKLRTVVDDVTDFLFPSSLSIYTFNVQRLETHLYDLQADPVITCCDFLLLSETWIGNSQAVAVEGFKVVNQFKRDPVEAGGCAIYRNEKMADRNKAHAYELYKYDHTEVKRLDTRHDDVGDICTARVEINGLETLLVAVYVSPKATTDQLHKFLTFNLMAYSPKLKGLFDHVDEERLYELPIIVGGDFNTILEAEDKFGKNIVTFMKQNFDLDLTNNPAVATTRGGTCIDGVFSRYVPNIHTRDYVSYFSYHKPLVTSVVNEDNVMGCE